MTIHKIISSYALCQLLRLLTVSLGNPEQKFDKRNCKGPERETGLQHLGAAVSGCE